MPSVSPSDSGYQFSPIFGSRSLYPKKKPPMLKPSVQNNKKIFLFFSISDFCMGEVKYKIIDKQNVYKPRTAKCQAYAKY